MRRRAFIAGLLVSSAVGGAHAQQRQKVYRLAVVNPFAPVADMTETGNNDGYRAFFRRLRELGYVEGRNLSIDRYSGGARTEDFAGLVAAVVRSNPDLIFATTSRLTRDLKAATTSIPIVANLADPVAGGIVSSLARPGGNITGTTVDAGIEIDGKRLEILREIVPSAAKVGYLASRRVWEAPDGAAMIEAGRRMGIAMVGPPLNPPLQEAEYRRVFKGMAEAHAEALIVGDQGENGANRQLIVKLANRARLPALYPFPFYADVGGLAAYGADIGDTFRHAADQVDQIFKGAKPSDIPFYQPTKFTLVINLKTAKALGLTVPPTLLIAANEVIE